LAVSLHGRTKSLAVELAYLLGDGFDEIWGDGSLPLAPAGGNLGQKSTPFGYLARSLKRRIIQTLIQR